MEFVSHERLREWASRHISSFLGYEDDGQVTAMIIGLADKEKLFREAQVLTSRYFASAINSAPIAVYCETVPITECPGAHKGGPKLPT